MTSRSRTLLKSYFESGDKPTETNFADKIDSFYHRDDLGWADYADTQYTSGSPLSVLANTDTLLPNDGLGGVKTYEPPDVTLYDAGTQKITGINGETRLWTLDCSVLPTSGGTTYIEFWLDIGGTVGELYRRIVSFPKGNGVIRPVTLTTFIYTLDTFEANGGSVYCRANGSCNIYDIRFILARTTRVL